MHPHTYKQGEEEKKNKIYEKSTFTHMQLLTATAAEAVAHIPKKEANSNH